MLLNNAIKRTLLLGLMITALVLSGCSKDAPQENVQEEPSEAAVENVENNKEIEAEEETTRVITDVLGREVTVPTQVDRVIVTGVGGLRLYVYAGDMSKLVGVEAVEQSDGVVGRAYTTVHQSLYSTLPVIGQGGPKNSNNPEAIIKERPDVIFTTYEDPEALQAMIDVPVIAIAYGDNSVFSKDVYTSLQLIGEVTGNAAHAEEQIAYIKACEEDLSARTSEIPMDEKPTVYIGAIGNRGARGIESTKGNHELLNAIHAINVVDETGKSGSIIIDKEQLLNWQPDYIFIDMDGLSLVQDDFKQQPDYYKALKAYQSGHIYGQLPYNYLTTNIDTAIANAYFIGKTIYPSAFEDIKMEEKSDEIYKQLVGEAFYDQMVADFGGYRKLEAFE